MCVHTCSMDFPLSAVHFKEAQRTFRYQQILYNYHNMIISYIYTSEVSSKWMTPEYIILKTMEYIRKDQLLTKKENNQKL